MIQNGLEIRAVVTGVIRHPLRGQAETAARKPLATDSGSSLYTVILA